MRHISELDPRQHLDVSDEELGKRISALVTGDNLDGAMELAALLHQRASARGDQMAAMEHEELHRVLELFAAQDYQTVLFTAAVQNTEEHTALCTIRNIAAEHLEEAGDRELAAWGYSHSADPRTKPLLASLQLDIETLEEGVTQRRLAYYRQRVEADITDAHSQYQLLHVMFDMIQVGDYEDIEPFMDVATQAVEQPNALFSTFSLVVDVLMDEDRMEEAYDWADRAAKAYENCGGVFASIGDWEFDLGHYEPATEAYRRSLAMEFNPGPAGTLASLLAKAKRWDEAADLLEIHFRAASAAASTTYADEGDRAVRNGIAGELKRACRKAGRKVPRDVRRYAFRVYLPVIAYLVALVSSILGGGFLVTRCT